MIEQGEFLLITWMHFMTHFEVSEAQNDTAHLGSMEYAQKNGG